jgi:hypothetical protein
MPFDYRRLHGSLRVNTKSRGYISRATAEDLGLQDELQFHYVRVTKIEQTAGKSYCLTVPSIGSFLQNRFDGLNSQGSEWDHVLVIDEGSCFRDDAARWRYTAATRAAKRLTWYAG